ncbi:helix-turn-helix transcriptional regulator [Clostridium nigeriense]|uniref:helix-turn-helix transcriptional regulator n=1 Tax=Clostridium nigeriense TaxID=1805470 RepID=UPI003D32A355
MILNYRQSLNLSQKDFAKLVKLSPVTIGYFENKKKYPNRKQHYQLSKLLNI